MDRNTDLFFKVADAIEREPQRYNQGAWYERRHRCGTTACIAGWAAALTLKKGDLNQARRAFESEYGSDLYFDPEEVAEQELGLSVVESIALFDEDWKPHAGLSVPDALRKIGEGAKIEDVSA